MRICGSITALATPFEASGALDLDAWQRLIELQLASGTQGLVVAGSTGEAAALLDVEYDTLLRTAVELVAGRVPVLAGTGLSNTQKTIELTRRAAALGADIALVVTPPYVRPTQDGLVAHYRAVADDGALPVLLYNVPGRTGTDMQPETVRQLASHPGIVGIKEAVDDEARMSALLAMAGDGFAVLSGDDATACRAQLAGAAGVISVVSNIVPGAFRALCDLARAGNTNAANALAERLLPLSRFMGVEPNPIPVKAILARLGYGVGLRLPLLSLSVQHLADADRFTALARALERDCRAATAA